MRCSICGQDPCPYKSSKMEHKTIRLTKSDGSLRPLEMVIDDAILLAIDHCEGNKSKALKGLRVGRSTFYRKLKDGA
jgi:transcriptional regulator of acetoin/glycerol metabolism